MTAAASDPAGAVRIAVHEDVEAIAAVLRRAFAEYEAAYTPEAFAATTPTADRIRERWSEGPIWIASLMGGIVGTVSVAPRGRALYVRSMALLPSARGHGLGSLLLECVEAHAKEHGFERLSLESTPFLHPAIRRYERFGFRRVTGSERSLLGTPVFTMAKELRPGGR